MNPKREGIFISYARKDGEPTAVELRQLLTGERFKVWQDRVSLEGGREWWVQITDALNNVQFMVLVLTPGVVASDIVRKEFRYARQQGVCVYLVKGFADLDFKTLPRWMSEQQIYDWFDPLERQKLVNDLKKTPDLKRVPFMADDLPKDFVPRPGEFDQLIGHLLAENREDPVAITAALRGAGGYGKTTLAKALCHDERIQDAFDDGILWVTLGETPGDLNAKVLELIEVLCGYKPDYTGTEAIAARFRELLADRDILLVIDDVWNHAHLRPFLQGGERCARLITTRNPKTLPDGVAEVPVDAMRESEAVALLGVGLGLNDDGENVRSTGLSRNDSAAKPLPPEGGTTNALRKLAARLGEWPLLLRLANGVLRNRTKSGEALATAMTYANRALDKRGLKAFDANNPLERNQAVTATLAVSLEQLTAEERERFFELAIFPEDIYVPMATLEQYWRLDDLDTDDLCDRLYHASLLLEFDLGTRVIRLHDVIRTFLRHERKADLPTLNQRLLDAHRPAAGWGGLADAEPYFWDHLAEHLIEAGLESELVVTVTQWQYLTRKIWLRNTPSVENDLLKARQFAPSDDPLYTLWRGIAGSSHLFNRCRKRNEVESTFFVRLRHFPDLQLWLEDFARDLERPVVIPKENIFLPDLPHPALIRTLEGHSDRVWGCAFSPDGKLIASVSDDNTLKLRDVMMGQVIRTFEGHWMTCCAFSPDGKFIVSGSRDNTLCVWDIRSGQTLLTLKGHSHSVSSCAYSPDGKLIVSSSDGGTIKLWDAETGQVIHTFEGHSIPVNSCAFRPNGNLIVSASDDSTLKLWDVMTGQVIRTLEGHLASVKSCAFSPDGRLIVSASKDETLILWDANVGQVLRTFEGHSEWVNDCAFSPDGKLIVSASWDETLRVWETSTGKSLCTLEGHLGVVNCCAFSPDGKFIVSSSHDATLKIWDASIRGVFRILQGHSMPVNGCAFSPDGKLIASASNDETLKVWDSSTGQELRTLESEGWVSSCAFSPDGKLIVSSSFLDLELRVWDASTGQELRTLESEGYVRSCAFSPDGKRIVSASSDKTLKVWDANSGELLRTLEGHSGPVRSCAFSPDGKLLVSASDDKLLKVWNVLTGVALSTLEGHSVSVSSCVFSADGKLIASASWDNTLKVWDADSGELLRTLEGHSAYVNGCAFSSDSKHIVSASSDRTLKVWDADSGECLATFYADGALNCCAMHGDLIVAGGARGVYFLKLVR